MGSAPPWQAAAEGVDLVGPVQLHRLSLQALRVALVLRAQRIDLGCSVCIAFIDRMLLIVRGKKRTFVMIVSRMIAIPSSG